MKIYKSEFGTVHTAKILKKTQKGYKVSIHCGHARTLEYIWYLKCPHGNHRTFTKKQDAINDAKEWLNRKEDKMIAALDGISDKRQALNG
jgi:hypothetical protein